MPELAQFSANAPLLSVTASLKPTARSPAAGKPVAPWVGVVLPMVGAPVLPPPSLPVKVWPRLQAPNVCAAEPAQLKLAALLLLPVPVNCSELPTAVLLLWLTGRFWLATPAAGPPLPVMAPS